jgi:hypothetical protein
MAMGCRDGSSSKTRGTLALSIGMVLLVAGCAKTLEETRRHTYAPSFNYITDTELQSAMWQLAAGVASLERIIGPERVVTPEERLDVIRILERMEAATASLGPEGWPSNHPRITRHAGRFREQLEQARRAVERDPPGYYLAGTVSGACLLCHGE